MRNRNKLRLRSAASSLKTTLTSKFVQQETSQQAAAFGGGLLAIGGQLYPGSIDGAAGEVVNVGRLASAVYAPKTGGGVTIVNGGGGTSSGGSVGAIAWRNIDFTGSNLADIFVRRHGDLSDKADVDDHPQYVHRDIARTITAVHSFAPETASAPFTIGANAAQRLVSGLNSEFVGGQLENVFMRKYANSPLNMNIYQVVSDDTDTAHTLGRAHIGNVGHVDFAGFAHRDRATATGYAFLQHASGATYINAPLGALVNFRVGNVDKLQLSSNGFSMFPYQDSAVQAAWARVGAGGGYLGHAYFGHEQQANTAGNYAVLQDGAGRTYVNSSLATQVWFRNGNANRAHMDSAGFVYYPGTDLRTDHYASQTTGWRVTYAGAADFRYLYADELHVKAFIADLEQALAGGQIICKSVAVLANNFSVPNYGASASLVVESFAGFPNAYVFQNNDNIAIRIFNRTSGTAGAPGSLQVTFAFGRVTAGTLDVTNKRQTWTFTRLGNTLVNGLPAGGHASTGTVVESGAIVLDFGVTGNGYYEVNAIDGQMGANSPYAQVVTWDQHPWYDRTVQVRMGNLTGVNFAGEYGLYAQGATNAQYIKAGNLGLRLQNVDLTMFRGSVRTVTLYSADGSMKMGSDALNTMQTTFDFNGTSGALRIGPAGAANLPNLAWTGSALQLRQNTTPVITLDSNGDSFFSGRMTIGTSGEIRQMDSANTGLRIWREGNVGRIGGYLQNVLQWYANTDGRLYAGGGNVALDGNGAGIVTNANITASNRLKFHWQSLAGAEQAFVAGRSFNGSDYQMMLSARGVGSSAWGTIALRARVAGQNIALPVDNQGGTLLVQPGNVFVGPVVGLILSNDTFGGDVATTVPAGQLRAVSQALRQTSTLTAVANHAVVGLEADGSHKVVFSNGAKITLAAPDDNPNATLLTLQSGWANWGTTQFHDLGYAKNGGHRVEVKGLVKVTSAARSNVIAVLPTGFRPKRREIMECMSSVGGGAGAQASRRVDIETTGEIIPTGWTPGLNDWISISHEFTRA